MEERLMGKNIAQKIIDASPYFGKMIFDFVLI